MKSAVTAALLLMTVGLAHAETDDLSRIYFTDVDIFDGTSSQLATDMNVLIEGYLIREISANPIEA